MSPPVEQLHGFVLILHESSPGHITHGWQSVEEFELAQDKLLLAGSIVTIAGVAFIVAFPPGALIALVPLTAFSSSEAVCEPRFAAVQP